MTAASPTVRAALRVTLTYFPASDAAGILSPSRRREYSRPRAFCARLLLAKGWSLHKVAAAFGRSDHTTSINWRRRANELWPETDFDALASDLRVGGLVAPTPQQPPAGKRADQAGMLAASSGKPDAAQVKHRGQSKPFAGASVKATVNVGNPGTNSGRRVAA